MATSGTCHGTLTHLSLVPSALLPPQKSRIGAKATQGDLWGGGLVYPTSFHFLRKWHFFLPRPFVIDQRLMRTIWRK